MKSSFKAPKAQSPFIAIDGSNKVFRMIYETRGHPIELYHEIVQCFNYNNTLALCAMLNKYLWGC